MRRCIVPRCPRFFSPRLPARLPPPSAQAGLLGSGVCGADNFPADQEAAEAAIAAYPGIQLSAQANRAFLARAVRYLAEAEGIRRFLDTGNGLPAANNTHQVAQAAAPASRVVYVDNGRSKLGCVHA